MITMAIPPSPMFLITRLLWFQLRRLTRLLTYEMSPIRLLMTRIGRSGNHVSTSPPLISHIVVIAHMLILHHADDAEIYDGAPVAVQLVGRRFEEEKVLVFAEILGDALGKMIA
jgi:hypothetical protein